MPPTTGNGWLYGLPPPAAGMELEVKARVTSDTLIVKDADAVLMPSVTCAVKAKEPVAVGVPIKMPVPPREIPGGNVPEVNDHVTGPDEFCSSKSCT